MAILGIVVENSKESYNFFSETRERLQDTNLVRNPFKGEIKKRGDMFVVSICPIYINFTPVVWGLAVVGALVFGIHWWHIALAGIGCLGIFWTKYFFYIFLKMGLRKNGYKGKIKLLGKKEIIERGILLWDN